MLGSHLALLALGAQTSIGYDADGDPDIGTAIQQSDREKIAEEMYDNASSLIMASWQRPSMAIVAATLSKTLYEQASGKPSAAWATFGICLRQAQALGC